MHYCLLLVGRLGSSPVPKVDLHVVQTLKLHVFDRGTTFGPERRHAWIARASGLSETTSSRTHYTSTRGVVQQFPLKFGGRHSKGNEVPSHSPLCVCLVIPQLVICGCTFFLPFSRRAEHCGTENMSARTPQRRQKGGWGERVCFPRDDIVGLGATMDIDILPLVLAPLPVITWVFAFKLRRISLERYTNGYYCKI